MQAENSLGTMVLYRWSVSTMRRLQGEWVLSVLVGVLAIVRGLGEAPSLGRTLQPLTVSLGQGPMLGR